MRDSGDAVEDGLTPNDWYRLLNQRVFFWATSQRLETLLAARPYRSDRHTVLTLDTRELLDRYANRVKLTTMNTGCTVPFPWPRGRRSFTPLVEFDYEASLRRRGRSKAIAELTVFYGVPDAADFVIIVEHLGGGKPKEVLFERD